MKIRFPEHLTGGVTSEPLRAVNPQKAPIRLIGELQMETGWTVQEFQNRGKTFFGHAMSVWLTLHNAGFTTITWEQAQDLSLDDLELIEEPGDRAAAAEAGIAVEEDASEPASPASSPDAEPAVQPRPASTRSKQPSRGSTAKSARGSRTS